MLIKYVTTWNELGLAFQQSSMHPESLECFQTSIMIYEKLTMHGNMSLALGDFILNKLMIFVEFGEGGLPMLSLNDDHDDNQR